MSLLNVWVEPQRALVGVDTHAMYLDPRGEPAKGMPAGRFETSKMIPIVHLNAVMAVRGSAILIAGCYVLCNMEPRLGLDQLFNDFPAIVAKNYAQLEQAARQQGHQASLDQEVMLVGWSRRAGKMRCLMLKQVPGQAGFVPHDVDELWLGSWDDDAQGVPPVDPCDDRSMAELMQAQRLDARQRFPNLPIGGRALVAELSRDQICLREVASLEQGHCGDDVHAFVVPTPAVAVDVDKLSALENIGARNGETARLLTSIDLSADALQHLDPADALQKVAAALQRADDVTRARVIKGLFGKIVEQVSPFLGALAKLA